VRVEHQREVLFARPDYWIVCDTMIPEDDAEHTYEALFHLDAEEAVVDPETSAVTVAVGAGEFRILPVGDTSVDVEIVEGQTEPEVQGWLPTGEHENLRPIPTAVFRWRASGPSTMGFLLLPREADEQFPVSGARPIDAEGAFALEAARPEGARDVFVSASAGAATVPGVLTTDAKAAMVRFDGAGEALSTFASGGETLTLAEE
jgi:hypothetical protein